MPADLQGYKVTLGDGNASTPFNALVQATEDSLNAIGDTTKNGFASGLIFDPAQIQQATAAANDWLAWDGAKWAKATPAATTAVVLGDTTLTAYASSFDFQSISGSYKHLMLVASLRTDYTADTDDNLGVRFNNDTGANYDGYSFRFRGTTPSQSGSESLAGTSAQVGNALQSDNNQTGLFGTLELYIPHYAGSSNNKVFHATAARKRGTTTSNLLLYRGMGAWRSNSAITRVTIVPLLGTNFLAGSRCALYGF